MNPAESESFNKLTSRQQRAIPYLICAPDILKGCREAKITGTTYYQWIQDPTFAEAIDIARNNAVAESLSKISAGVGLAVDKLLSPVDDNNSEVARKSATSIIKLALKLRELDGIESRLQEIETLVLERRTYR